MTEITPDLVSKLIDSATAAANTLDALMGEAENEGRQIAPDIVEGVLAASSLFAEQPDFGLTEFVWALLIDYRDALTIISHQPTDNDRPRLLRAAENQARAGHTDRARVLLEISDRWATLTPTNEEAS